MNWWDICTSLDLSDICLHNTYVTLYVSTSLYPRDIEQTEMVAMEVDWSTAESFPILVFANQGQL